MNNNHINLIILNNYIKRKKKNCEMEKKKLIFKNSDFVSQIKIMVD